MKRIVTVGVIIFTAIQAIPSTYASPNLLDRVATAPDNAQIFAVLSKNRLWTTRNGGDRFDVIVISSQGSTLIETTHTPSLGMEYDDDSKTDESSPPSASPVETSPVRTLDVPIDLAISNTGQWAVAYETRFCVQNSTGYGYRCVNCDNLVGVRFDQQHRLWISTHDKLLVFENPNTTMPSDTVPISPSCKALLLGPGPTEVTVLTSGGFATYRMTSTGIRRQVQYTIANLSTVFPIRHHATRKNTRQAEWYIVVGGHLFKQCRSGHRADTGIHLQGRVTKLLVDGDNSIASHSDGSWHIQTRGSIDAADIALLADGRFIDVGLSGIKIHRQAKHKSDVDMKSVSQLNRLPTGIHRKNHSIRDTDHTPLLSLSSIMPPPCSRRFVYIPDIRVSFLQRTNTHRATSTPNGRHCGWYFGIHLSWPIEPPRLIACIKKWETHLRRESRRRQAWSKLIRSNLTLKNAPSSTNPSDIIDQRIKQQRDAAMMNIIRAQ